MLGRTVFAATLFALAQFAVASPPGCLLGAANQYNNPADIKSICQSKNLKEMVAKICGDDVDAAMAALADICNEQNVSIGKYITILCCGWCSKGRKGTAVILRPLC
jgi:hypothetical protein